MSLCIFGLGCRRPRPPPPRTGPSGPGCPEYSPVARPLGGSDQPALRRSRSSSASTTYASSTRQGYRRLRGAGAWVDRDPGGHRAADREGQGANRVGQPAAPGRRETLHGGSSVSGPGGPAPPSALHPSLYSKSPDALRIRYRKVRRLFGQEGRSRSRAQTGGAVLPPSQRAPARTIIRAG